MSLLVHQSFRAPSARKRFRSVDKRSWHVNEEHPLARPTLYLRDRAAPTMTNLRAPIRRDEVSMGSCTSITATLDGAVVEELEPGKLGGLLAEQRAGHICARPDVASGQMCGRRHSAGFSDASLSRNAFNETVLSSISSRQKFQPLLS